MFVTPVVASDGFVYERFDITAWLESNDLSPMTGLLLPNKVLKADRSMASKVIWYCRRQETLKKQRVMNAVNLQKKLALLAHIMPAT